MQIVTLIFVGSRKRDPHSCRDRKVKPPWKYRERHKKPELLKEAAQAVYAHVLRREITKFAGTDRSFRSA